MKSVSFMFLLVACLSLQANARSSKCDDFELSGTFKNKAGAKFTIAQDGCNVWVRDYQQDANWRFDVSGVSNTFMSEKYIKVNSITPDAAKAAESARINLENLPGYEGSGTRRLEVRATFNIPKGVHSPVDVDYVVTGAIYLFPRSGPQAPDKQLRIDEIVPSGIVVRMKDVRSNLLFGPLKTGFLLGANYILEQVSTHDAAMSLLNLVRVK